MLDTYCCEGGCSLGYAAAGFEMVGVDVKRQPRYPFTFIEADALEVLADKAFLATFDAIHASPPCQAHSITKHTHTVEHPDLIEPTRRLLQASGLPWVMENVPGSPLLNPVELCGAAFGLETLDDDGTPLVLKRHRLFESSHLLLGTGCACVAYRRRGYRVGGSYGAGSTDKDHAKNVRKGGYTPSKERRAELIGCEHMTLNGLAQAIPPAYTEHLGRQLLDHLAMAA